jgi:hypothetical protein
MKSRVITALFFTCCACATHTQARTVFASPKGKKCHTDYCRQSGDPAAVAFAWGGTEQQAAPAVCMPDEWQKKKIAPGNGTTKIGIPFECNSVISNKKYYQRQ